MKYRDWVVATDGAVRAAVATCFHDRALGGWQENAITRDVLLAIGAEQIVRWEAMPFQSAWQVFKAVGPYETSNGDIAMHVVLHAKNGHREVGSKHFEAKKLDLKTRSLSSIDVAQLARMQYLPSHEVLLYVAGIDADQSTHASVHSLPTPIATMLLEDGFSAMFRASHPFVGIFGQALMGRGLNWDRTAATSLEVASRASRRLPGYVLEAHLASNGLELEPIQAPRGYESLAGPKHNFDRDPSDDFHP